METPSSKGKRTETDNNTGKATRQSDDDYSTSSNSTWEVVSPNNILGGLTRVASGLVLFSPFSVNNSSGGAVAAVSSSSASTTPTSSSSAAAAKSAPPSLHFTDIIDLTAALLTFPFAGCGIGYHHCHREVEHVETREKSHEEFAEELEVRYRMKTLSTI
jgi:hypothetical protein